MLRAKNQMLKKESPEKIQDYVHRFKSLIDELALIGNVMGAIEKAYYLLNGLREEYGAFTTIMLKNLMPAYTSVVPQMISYDLRNCTSSSTIHSSIGLFYAERKNKGKIYKKIKTEAMIFLQ